MKTLGKIILLSAGISLLTACSDESGQSNLLEPTRSLTVKSLLTRTTIGYEGSDFSHLEWREGDRVAYVTDLPGEVFRTAEVSDNRFTAELPARAAADNVLIVVWPAASNQGRPLAEATLTLAAETVQTAGAEFDGSLLPMYARIPIPASGAEVDAEYLQPASVVRISIDPTGHEEENLKSVTLKANEYLAGNYNWNPDGEPQWNFTGVSQTIRTTVSGEDALLEKEPYVYMVVNRAAYTGVEVRIETDRNTYTFPDGTMQVDLPGFTLYRIHMKLDDAPGPKVSLFTQVTDQAELTAEGTYLIVADKSSTEYYTPDKRSYTSVIPPAAIPFTEAGIESSEAVTPFTWKIERNADTGMYSLYSNRDNVYVGSPGAMMVNDYGKLFFKEEIPQTDEGAVTYYWDISVDAEKAMVKSLRLENTYFQFNANRNVEAFCTCTPDTNGWQHIKIFKLRE